MAEDRPGETYRNPFSDIGSFFGIMGAGMIIGAQRFFQLGEKNPEFERRVITGIFGPQESWEPRKDLQSRHDGTPFLYKSAADEAAAKMFGPEENDKYIYSSGRLQHRPAVVQADNSSLLNMDAPPPRRLKGPSPS